MKKFICYLTGGLGNRIIPLGSMKEYARMTGRKLFLYWPLDFRCGGRFSSLYSEDIPEVDEDFLFNLPKESTRVFCRFPDGASNDLNIYGRKFLNSWGTIGGEPSLDDNTENIVCCTNTFLSCIPREQSIETLKGLQIKESILEKAEKIASTLKLDKSFLGIHMRGTDFNTNPNNYLAALNSVEEDLKEKVFVCSDDATFEQHIIDNYPHAVRRKDKVFMTKKTSGEAWTHNTNTTEESLLDALVDVILLSKTRLLIYNKASTFAEYANLLS